MKLATARCGSSGMQLPSVHLHQRVSQPPLLFAMCLCGVSRCDGMQYKRPRASTTDELLRRGLSSHRSPLVSRRRVEPLDARSTTRPPTSPYCQRPVSNLCRPSVKTSEPASTRNSPTPAHQPVATEVQTLSSHFRIRRRACN